MKKTITAAVLASTFFAVSMPAMAFEPSAKTECIAPSDPGGGWDFTCRTAGRVMSELGLVPGNVQTINMPGAGGGVAFAHVVSKRSGDDNLLIAASTAVPTRLAQNQFPGMNKDMVTWIATVGSDYGVIAVPKDSPYQDLNDLMSAIKHDPKSVKFAGASASGGWDHLKVLIAAKAAGIKTLRQIPYLSYNNGGSALTQVVGGHVSAFTGDVSEARGFWESGDIRILAVLSPERLPGEFSDIPTAREQGIDAIGPNWRGFYMPADIDDEARDYWINAVNTLYESDEWKKVMKANGLMPFHHSGADFDAFMAQQVKDIHELSVELGLLHQ
ncbi:Bug family tripartite tricarboxylate transporter substrate binding protein [Larsenimonas salina]|uniref:Bug family tripartite tricarboxylate transporter substrate binding protein n=1 Tax=Larsenimonas salina TaxID=1295565 RepID=UPI002072B807|nr:tripartite tricarboxylate transporter substrate binding protein [Larsenimonas salina]MCM5705130.1 tripartite tricarboxylate transporter substrate binding protein [Larsenimonas salina]